MSDKLKLDDLVPHTVVTKMNIQSSNGNWAGNEHTSVIYLPQDATPAYKMYRKMIEDAYQRRAIWEMIYHVAGGVDTNQYLQGIAETERALKQAEEMYSFKALAILIVNQQANPKASLELFDDQIIANSWVKENLGVTLSDVQTGSLPEHLRGTRIFEQNWHSSTTKLINTSLTPLEVNNRPMAMVMDIGDIEGTD